MFILCSLKYCVPLTYVHKQRFYFASSLKKNKGNFVLIFDKKTKKDLKKTIFYLKWSSIDYKIITSRSKGSTLHASWKTLDVKDFFIFDKKLFLS